MKDTPILSVVRQLHVNATENNFLESSHNSPFWHTNYSEAQRRDNFREYIENFNEHAGCYVKSGGSGVTANIQEAQIFGWSRKAKENLSRFKAPYYEIVPILIEPA